ncbi:ATP-binding cassette domain-containing protein [Candidatus Parcubacteria bacterium]|nr:ATP-binding cassette domain-containing protein [Patescibacteria group bacterium]MBU4309320.1 ATP-binding cassette domain-containing protein [Patescibacteria group bacterium]MBU4432297.1 ATP-binding cassette domain-containing protein [Patescibacteria group bacterium]MBU4577681.1 ATP-binding cassette domain-containing protein [Patescibacteria group bacterium]MCG2697367.1 ATP-binding cassette domain-containing protein [Candidatus Parcubacteria bacterium]
MSGLININKISKSFGPHVIFDEATFYVAKKQRIGIIGRNGAGKTTLFKMLLGEEKIDSGEIAVFDGTRIGYLEQQEKFLDTDTVIGFLERDSGKETWECAKVAGAFRLKNELLDSKISALSGGYRMRVKLTAMLLRDPNLLLLDEPTNHLDLSTLLLLEEFLKTYNGSYMVISHDREFLRSTCDKTLEVDQGKLYFFPCSLDAYLAQKELKDKTDEKYNKKIKAQKKQLQDFVDRFKYQASKASMAQSKMKQLKRLSEVSIRQSLKTAQIVIPDVANKSGFAFNLDSLSIGYAGKKIADISALDIRRGDHVAVLGDNGQGKTTFLKTLNGELPVLSGEFAWAYKTKIAYYDQHVTSGMNPREQVGEYLERQAGVSSNIEDVYRIAGNFLFYGDDIKKTIAMLSGGEKARLCIAGILLQECNVLLLDEPTNHLDFETVTTLADALSKSKATILFISHNREFIHAVADKIIEVGEGVVKFSKLKYDDYLHELYMKAGLGAPNQSAEQQAIREDDKEARKAKQEKRKELKKELGKIEKGIEYDKALEQKLLAEYEADNFKFDRERDVRMKQLKDSIYYQEDKLLELEIEMEELV